MDHILKASAEGGDFDKLYSLIKEDAYLLEHIDEVPFIDTPLHIAASTGQTNFALEIMRLKPSFARKPNQDGYTPIHLALHNRHTQLVLRLVELDSNLVRVHGREGRTPLHLAAEYGIIDVLADFLVLCPKSIQDVTIQKETALHIAVKNDQVEALKVILGWLHLVHKNEVLYSSNDQGNNILHLAVYSNQIEMVSLLMNRIDLNKKNLTGSTALDILQDSSKQFNNQKLQYMLLRGGALRGSQLPNVTTQADSMKTRMLWHERWILSHYRKKLYMSIEHRNTILVVAALIATANYQAIITTPNYDPGDIMFSIEVNIIAFLVSLVEIYLNLPQRCGVLQLVLLLILCYMLFVVPYSLPSLSYQTTTTRMGPTFILLLLYYSKWPLFLYKFIPFSSYKKSMDTRLSIVKKVFHLSQYHETTSC